MMIAALRTINSRFAKQQVLREGRTEFSRPFSLGSLEGGGIQGFRKWFFNKFPGSLIKV
jgi:hypothetical protein